MKPGAGFSVPSPVTALGRSRQKDQFILFLSYVMGLGQPGLHETPSFLFP